MSDTTVRTAPVHTRTTPVQFIARLIAVVFLIVGVAGFIPGLTSNVGDLMFAGMNSGALLLGVFQVSVLHNIVHLLFGIVGLVLARTPIAAKRYLVYGGVVYFVLWIYGMVTGMSMANFVPLNTADNWLHLGLAIGMTGLGLIAGHSVVSSRRARSGHRTA